MYDFSGKKWQENEYDQGGNLFSRRSYMGSFEFEGNSLQKVFHPSGFIENLNRVAKVSGEGQGNITGSQITSTQKQKIEGRTEYVASQGVELLPGFESVSFFSAEIKLQSSYQWNYILRDHINNTRILFSDKNNDGLIKQDASAVLNEVLLISNYTPFGTELGGSHQKQRYSFEYMFNGKQDNGFSGLTDYGARWLDKNLMVWRQVDPMAQKYSSYSPYNFTMNNPLRFVDPDGREVWVNYGNNQRAKYENGRLYNEDGSKYKGKDSFVQSVSKYLGMMNKTEIGNKVLSSLSSSKNSFTFTNETSKSGGTAQFAANSNSESLGGKIKAGNLSGSKLGDMAKLDVVAHELFHAYQNENKEFGPSVNNEVGAYLFGAGVAADYQNGSFGGGFGKLGVEGQSYQNAMNSMLISGYNQNEYESAIQNFKSGSASNVITPTHPKGLYENFSVKPISTSPLIRAFSPYIR